MRKGASRSPGISKLALPTARCVRDNRKQASGDGQEQGQVRLLHADSGRAGVLALRTMSRRVVRPGLCPFAL